LKFKPWVTDPDILQGFRHVRLEDDRNDPLELLVERVWNHSGKWVIRFKNCDSIDQAEELVGRTLTVSRDDFSPLPEGEYYWFQIEGLKVYEDTGEFHGTVTEIIQTGSNDVYVVKNKDKELLLPMIDSIVQTIDLEKGTLIFHRMEGMFEDHPV